MNNRNGDGQWKRAAHLSLTFVSYRAIFEIFFCTKKIKISPASTLPAVLKRMCELKYVTISANTQHP